MAPSISKLASAALTVVSLSAASPVDSTASYQVKQVSFASRGSLNVAEAVFQPWLKYGKGLSDKQKSACEQAGRASTTPVMNGTEFLIPVQIGEPPQTLMVDLDTGSANFWVWSNYTDPEEHYFNQTEWTPGPSATRMPNGTFYVQYGTGAAEGIVFHDTVSVGGVVASHQSVGAATLLGLPFPNDATTDGLLGMAAKTLNTVQPVQQNTFFDNIKPTLKEKLFAANLHRYEPGQYDFGFIDHDKLKGPPTYTDVVGDTGFWQIEMDGFAVDNQPGNFGNAADSLAIVDTGTTLIYLPPNATDAYLAGVDGAEIQYGIWTVPCAATLPDLTIRIGSTPFVVPGTNLNYGPIAPSSTTCVVGVQSNAGLGLTVLGDAFINNFYVIFRDETSRQVGFANKKA